MVSIKFSISFDEQAEVTEDLAPVANRATPTRLPGHCWGLIYNEFSLHSNFLSLALFAFRLRSSVVSVLFSLISETSPWRMSMIKPIFVAREEPAELAYGSLHCVPSLTLLPGDAKDIRFFTNVLSLSGALEKNSKDKFLEMFEQYSVLGSQSR